MEYQKQLKKSCSRIIAKNPKSLNESSTILIDHEFLIIIIMNLFCFVFFKRRISIHGMEFLEGFMVNFYVAFFGSCVGC